MSIFNAIKKFFGETPDEKTGEAQIEDIAIDQLSKRIAYELDRVKSKKAELKRNLESSTLTFSKVLTKIIGSLEDIDLSKRKDYEKIKDVVRQNLDFYIAHLKKLDSDLSSLKEEEFDNYVRRLTLLLNNFNRASHMHFERATILIGKELEDAKKTRNSFMKEIDSIIGEAVPIKKREELLKNISKRNTELEEIKLIIDNNKKELLALNNNLSEKKKLYDEMIKKINSFKEGKDFKNILLAHQQRSASWKEIDKEIQKVKEEIDVKSLARTYHHDEKKRAIIDNYNKNFQKALKEDEELKFLNLLGKDSEHHNTLVSLRNNIFQLENTPKTETETTLIEMTDELAKLELYIRDLELRVKNEETLVEKINKKKEELISDIKITGLKLGLSIS